MSWQATSYRRHNQVHSTFELGTCLVLSHKTKGKVKGTSPVIYTTCNILCSSGENKQQRKISHSLLQCIIDCSKKNISDSAVTSVSGGSCETRMKLNGSMKYNYGI